MTSPASRSVVKPNLLRTSLYDQASSLLLALLILIGLVALVLLTVWLTNRIFIGQTAVPVELMDFSDGGGDGPVSGGQTIATPDEIRDMKVEEPAIKETFNAISAVVKTKASEFDDPTLLRKDTPTGGFGDGRRGGRGGGDPGTGRVVRRWEVRFAKGATLDAYARQLDFFHVELGVLLPDGRAAYAYNLTKPKPDARIVDNPSEKEKRYYLTWRGGDLQKADLELLARAGIDVGGGFVMKFLPPEVEAQLAALEKAYAGAEADSNYKSIRKTRFGIRLAGRDYAFYVIEQTYNR